MTPTTATTWRPTLGAIPERPGTRFRVWAPAASVIVLVVDGPEARTFPMAKAHDGHFEVVAPTVGPGARYRYLVDGEGPFPDPASRFQPEGVHGPSEVVDPSAFAWSDARWRGVAHEDLVLYELHVGTFTPEGTFRAAAGRLGYLAELGVTAIELMPVADFPGDRGWGYDGVDLFAPARCYGAPEDLRTLVDEAHRHGLAVLLDVVYNHLGPDGNYLGRFSPDYFSKTHQTSWGPAVNLDGVRSRSVRDFFVENAAMWIHEYHMDGLRLDATHHLFDDGERHVLAELSARVRRTVADRPVHLIAEDPRNLAHMVRAESAGGWGLDGLWSDDFHHELVRYLTGDAEGVFRDFEGSLADLATTIARGWLYCGGWSVHREFHRGTDPEGLEPRRFVFCIQNHDRIGNRAFGERLNQRVDPATYRAATALLMATGATPLLFMGQEWAASAPFLFFADHPPALAEAVRRGRRHEFRHYAEFRDPEVVARLPDPQAESTFLTCKLDWSERTSGPHAATLRLYRDLLRLRRDEPALRSNRCGSVAAAALGADTILVRREGGAGESMLLIAHFKGSGSVAPDAHPALAAPEGQAWTLALTTEDPPYAPAANRPAVDLSGPAPAIHFPGTAAVVLRATRG